MTRVPYGSTMDNLIYVVVCIRSDIAHVRCHWIHDALDATLLKLDKFQTNDNGVGMIIKVLPRQKFKVCCEIVGLIVTFT